MEIICVGVLLALLLSYYKHNMLINYDKKTYKRLLQSMLDTYNSCTVLKVSI